MLCEVREFFAVFFFFLKDQLIQTIFITKHRDWYTTYPVRLCFKKHSCLVLCQMYISVAFNAF